MNGYLFDTNIVRLWYAQNALIVARVSTLPNDSLLYISAITIGEIEFGHLSVNSKPAERSAFRRWIARTFDPHRLEITNTTAQSYASLRRFICDNYYKKSKYIQLYEDAMSHILGIDENDLWMVAQAHHHGLKFVTADKMTRINEVLGNIVDMTTWPQA